MRARPPSARTLVTRCRELRSKRCTKWHQLRVPRMGQAPSCAQGATTDASRCPASSLTLPWSTCAYAVRLSTRELVSYPAGQIRCCSEIGQAFKSMKRRQQDSIPAREPLQCTGSRWECRAQPAPGSPLWHPTAPEQSAASPSHLPARSVHMLRLQGRTAALGCDACIHRIGHLRGCR